MLRLVLIMMITIVFLFPLKLVTQILYPIWHSGCAGIEALLGTVTGILTIKQCKSAWKCGLTLNCSPK